MSISNGAPAILFQGVWKSFDRHAGQILLRDRLRHLFQSHRPEKFHALSEVSFRIEQGESVAIIGHNGAGKSTVLNLTTKLCRPDRGRVEVQDGRIAPLLDLGAGFHPDLTGAENVCDQRRAAGAFAPASAAAVRCNRGLRRNRRLHQ